MTCPNNGATMPETDLDIIEACAEQAQKWSGRVGNAVSQLERAPVRDLPTLFAQLRHDHTEAADWLGLVTGMIDDPEHYRPIALKCIGELRRVAA